MVDEQKIRITLLQLQPWFGQQLGSLKIIKDGSVHTLEVDGITLKYNQEYLNWLGFKLGMSAFAHEVVHCLKGDFARGYGKDERLWNMATDYVCNDILKKSGFDLHPDWLYDEQFSGMSAEKIYDIIQKGEKDDAGQAGAGFAGGSGESSEGSEGADGGGEQPPDVPEKDESEGGDSGGSEEGSSREADGQGEMDEGGNQPEQGGTETEAGEGLRDVPVRKDTDKKHADTSPGNPGDSPVRDYSNEKWCVGVVKQAQGNLDERKELAKEWLDNSVAAYMVCKGMGSSNAFLRGEYEELLHPKQRWEDILRSAFMESIKQEYSYRKPNRRSNGGILLPVVGVPYIGDIYILVDCSGSMNKEALYKLFCEVAGIKGEIGESKVNIVYFNSEVVLVEDDVTLPYKPSVTPSGGTNFVPPFEYINKRDDSPALVLVYTDGDCSSYPRTELLPECNVIWLGTQMFSPPFGEVIVIS